MGGEPGTVWKPAPRACTQPPSPPDKSGTWVDCPLALSNPASDRTMLPMVQSFTKLDRDIFTPCFVSFLNDIRSVAPNPCLRRSVPAGRPSRPTFRPDSFFELYQATMCSVLKTWALQPLAAKPKFLD